TYYQSALSNYKVLTLAANHDAVKTHLYLDQLQLSILLNFIKMDSLILTNPEFSQEIFTKWKIRKAVYKVGSKVMQDILSFLYKRKNLVLTRKTLEVLFKQQNKSSKKWNAKFGNFERQCKLVERNSMD
ncbi:unnamed protein product, partial [Meganyctiphanes norvegica]